MVQRTIEKSGAVTFWTAHAVDIARLRAGVLAVDAGLEDLLPEASTPLTALRQALEATFPKHLVRRLSGNGFAVVSEDKGETENEYQNICAAVFENENVRDSDIFVVSRMSYEDERNVRAAYNHARGTLHAHHLGTFISTILNGYLGGTLLRKAGGVYWLPEHAAEKWTAIAPAIEAAAVHAGALSIYHMQNIMDESAIRAVRDALVSEVTAKSAKITEEIISGDLGERALQSREREAAAMIAKVARYEGLLETSLADVRDALGEVKSAAAAAALVASTAGEDGSEQLATASSIS